MEGQALETGGENTAATYNAKRVCAWTGLCLTGLLLFGSGLQWLWAAGIGPLLPEPLNNMWVQTFVPLQMIAMPVTIVLLSRTKGSAPEKRTMPFGWLARNFVIAYAVMVIGNLIGTVLMMMFTGGKAQNPLVAYSLDPGSEALKVLFIVLLGPLLEEILFRKLLIDRTRLFGEKNAILFSALLFGLFHVNLFQFFYAFGIGLIFGYIYVRTGKVLYTW
nr:CPBP family intramembrane metalloprotease [bacterium]